jgi:hypothetical protein
MKKETEVAILGMVQMFIQSDIGEAPLTPENLGEALDKVLALNSIWDAEADREQLLAILETRFSIWIGTAAELIDYEGHVPWLAARKLDLEWDYWNRYRILSQKQIADASLDELDNVTDRILSHLEDPSREGSWDRRGLVVGHVQSGKTANYAGLITKAVDSGYKIIIVLAGLHNSLRSQTQIRLEEAFLGYESNPPGESRGLRPTGVGLINPNPLLRPDSITNRSERGDFNKAVSGNFSINPGGRPLLFVVKKNSSVLKNIIEWVEWTSNATDADTGRKFVSGVPLLIIDDEADNASVDTKGQVFDEFGQPDGEHDPSTINSRIRTLLMLFEQRAYVGYTATPFANIFIHEQGETSLEGPDLFPSSFIVNLSTPSDYFGPSFVFGQVGREDGDRDSSRWERNHFIRPVSDHADSLANNERSGWIPPKHRNGHRPMFQGIFCLPPSLREAIQAFILATAVRHARGQSREHNSMLVHVSRFTSVQNLVKEQVEAEVSGIRRELRYGEALEDRGILSEMRTLWETDFIQVSQDLCQEHEKIFGWSEIEEFVVNVASALDIREINGSAGDVLDYAAAQETGLNVIAIGGDKLSRGLTLEGLTVTYFLRASRMYDTLMQMGRWFGYRPGYTDLCRIYMPSELADWFGKITEASDELRDEFDHMAAVGGTPRNYGLRVQSHPTLMITSRVKMRTGTNMRLDYSGAAAIPTVFHRDTEIIEKNRDAVGGFLQRIDGVREENPKRLRGDGREENWSKSHYWKGVSPGNVTRLLSEYISHEDSERANSRLLREYIEKQLSIGDLSEWNVLLSSGGEGEDQIEGLSFNLVKRVPKVAFEPLKGQIDAGRYVIGTLLSPRDEAIDLETEGYQRALDMTRAEWRKEPGRRVNEPRVPSGLSIRRVRDKSTGLLLIYPLDPGPAQIETDFPVFGFVFSFPANPEAISVNYRVTNLFMNTKAAFD